MLRRRIVLIAAGVLGLGAAEAQAGGFLRALAGRTAVRAGAAAVGSTASTASTPAIKIYGPDVLTVDQLTACVRTANELDKSSDEVDTKRADLDAKLGEVKARRAKLKEREGQLRGSNRKALALYNAEVDATNKLIRVAKADQASFNATAQGHNSRLDEYNGRCAKRYYADDMEQAKQRANVAF